MTHVTGIIVDYRLVMTNIAMENHHAIKFGKPSISMGHLYHGYVGHNQRVGQHPLKHSVVQQPSQAADNEAVEYFEAQTMMASGRGEFQGGTGGEKSRTAGEKCQVPLFDS